MSDEERADFLFKIARKVLSLMAEVCGDDVLENMALPNGVSGKQADKNFLDMGNLVVR
ncbi:MAG: hypothetical protein HRU46_14425 [Verrucomicrobiales bacterium]|nr:hypothetical protein [Verrucomicrobiales bacterium]